MKRFEFKDALYIKKGKVLPVANEEREHIGFIEKVDISGCEKGHGFTFTDNDGTTVAIGIQKRGIKNLLAATYLIKTTNETYTLKDKVGNSLLYFCVEGNIDGKNIRVEENWSKEVEVKVDHTHIATIRPADFSFHTIILVEDNLCESSILFAVVVLMYFMYKIYKNESEFIEDILFD
ncbi:hypothetical protein P5G51_000985 [Virgibacillus sp. 179-BFC.A HS]|uniref:Uncharacterized protein n=1 Tax=Tigheibacillus jepli TaxID=3035914 RepID=A0ABU5CCY9_9BACI|nr:hypothetical protein [Virgibacillus sp. 179-BFC.A HS]MDY0404169.1 hypothetical protein [Virgibacillus sp. 179-BFC.A HS]